MAAECCYDVYVVTRALAELALGSPDPGRMIALRQRVGAQLGPRAFFAGLALQDAEQHVVARARTHICRSCGLVRTDACPRGPDGE